MKAINVMIALNMTISNRQNTHEAPHHSDRGLHYYSELHQSTLRKHNIIPSLIDSCDYYQYPLAERVHGLISQEFLLCKYNTLDELKRVVKESINIYNPLGPHLTPQMNTPSEAHQTKSLLRKPT